MNSGAAQNATVPGSCQRNGGKVSQRVNGIALLVEGREESGKFMANLKRIDDRDKGTTRFTCLECGWKSDPVPIHQARQPDHECEEPRKINPVFS